MPGRGQKWLCPPLGSQGRSQGNRALQEFSSSRAPRWTLELGKNSGLRGKSFDEICYHRHSLPHLCSTAAVPGTKPPTPSPEPGMPRWAGPCWALEPRICLARWLPARICQQGAQEGGRVCSLPFPCRWAGGSTPAMPPPAGSALSGRGSSRMPSVAVSVLRTSLAAPLGDTSAGQGTSPPPEAWAPSLRGPYPQLRHPNGPSIPPALPQPRGFHLALVFGVPKTRLPGSLSSPGPIGQVRHLLPALPP